MAGLTVLVVDDERLFRVLAEEALDRQLTETRDDPEARVRLQPANAAMKPLTIDSRDVTVQGVVTGLIRTYST